ncbi:MAG: S9 family peptidase, partial [Pseudomonadota bacterium]
MSLPSYRPSVRAGAAFAVVSAAVFAVLPTRALCAPDLPQIMADPDWIGSPVEAAWWQLDGRRALYRVKRSGSTLDDIVAIDLATGDTQVLDHAAQATTDGPAPVLDSTRQRALFTRSGSLWMRHLENGELRQLASADQPVRRAHFSADGASVLFERGGRWWRYDLDSSIAHALTDLKFEKAPYEVEAGSLAAEQVRLFVEVADDVTAERAAHDDARAGAAADPGRAAAPWYLGPGKRIIDAAPSADGRWLLAAIGAAKAERGKQDHMPKFVTRSGYVEVEDVRTLVGRDATEPTELWLLDLITQTKHEVDLSSLEGRDVDPLAALKATQDIEPHDGDDLRPVAITDFQWHPREAVALVQLFAIDNKDRWLLSVDARGEAPSSQQRHRLHDPAWVSYSFNDFGWLDASSTRYWLLSEEDGYSHLYQGDLARA